MVDARSVDALFGDLFGASDELSERPAGRSARVSDPAGLGPQVSGAAGGGETSGRAAAGSETRAERAERGLTPAADVQAMPPAFRSFGDDPALLGQAVNAAPLAPGGLASGLSPPLPSGSLHPALAGPSALFAAPDFGPDGPLSPAPSGGIVPEYESAGLPYRAGDLVGIAQGADGNAPTLFSPAGVRYADGTVRLASTDLASAGFGTAWGLTRSWTNEANMSLGWSGSGWVVTQLPHLRQDSGGTLTEVANGFNLRYFDYNGTSYTARFWVPDQLTYNSGSNEYQQADSQGDLLRYNDFSAGMPANKKGTFKSWIDANGNLTSVTSYTSDGKPQEIQRSNTTGSTTITESYLFSYIASGVNAGLTQSVVLRRQTNGGAWTTVRQVQYTYYSGEAHGNTGDLKLVQVQDGSGNTLDTTYYRYYTGESGGYVHALKYVFRPQSYARLTAALGTGIDSISDTSAAPSANDYFEWDASQRCTKHTVQGDGGSVSGGGLGTYTYTYTASTNSVGYNSWATKTVETLPDGNSNTAYTNAYGEVMLKVYHDQSSGNNWEWFAKYDDTTNTGRLTLAAQPSAVTGYDDTKADLLNNVGGNYQYLSDTSGLVTALDYGASTTATTTTAGNVAGYFQDVKVQQGETGTATLLAGQQYIARASQAVAIYPLASTTRYRNSGSGGPETTSFTYTWNAPTPYGASGMPQAVTVSKPVIGTTQNGPNVADQEQTNYDGYGRPVWFKDADSFIFYTEYDQATGAVTKTIADVDTTKTSDFTGLPSGWTTPSGGGLHLITLYTVDGLGRTTKLTDPLGNVTYTVYKDTNYEVRVYPGWQAGTSTTTGPTQLYREDRPGSYVEALTMSAAPHVTGSQPDGTEAVGSVQTLSREITSNGGQLVYRDAYFNLSGITYSTAVTLGTSGTNYYRTQLDYDSRGRQYRTLTPTATYYKTVYDGLDRPVSAWVGTDDGTPGNMTQTAGYVYDSGGVGDSDLTQQTLYPGGSAANRVSNYWYDWRDRLVASKDGVQGTEDTTTHRPILFRTLDNLDEVTQVQRYDGDGVSITVSSGQPQAPSASLLRAQTNYSYDDQMRLYQTQVYSVNPSTGAVSSAALTTNLFYDHRGNVLKESDPGGLVSKWQYDGARRVKTAYQSNGGGDVGWTDAGNVTGDAVLTQVEPTYDADGNVILTKTRQRFHDETATGALGDPTTAPKARVSYAASYYDAANRLTATVDVGTNGGTAWTRPSSPPSASDTVLVTSLAYTAAGFVDTVTDPRGIVEKNYYDNLGRVTKTIEAYTDGTPTSNTNKTTEFTYDGMNHTLTLQADLVSGGYEQTKWVYGVTTSGGSNVNSNDILAAVQHPDKSSGNPSGSEQDSYTVNALGQTLTQTDRNGNVHTLTYDVLGRLTADAVTTLGSGADGAVRRIEVAYDTQGNPYLFTSYDAATGGNVVNQVQRAFNGLAQLTTEYQSHSGAVNINTTPKVQYAYTEMSGGANNSRLTSITYPNGKVLTYNYNTGVDNTISRLSSLSDTSGTLESYSYLGLATVVKRGHSQPGVDLTYIKQSGESNGDAGDQYTGLDRFGRVVDQRWIVTASGSHTDRFQYGYDRDGNRLYRDNLVNTAFGELYHANGAGNGYDNLNQLQAFARGTLNGTHDTISSPSHSQSWSFDAAGNWSSLTTDGTGVNRTHNKQNEVTGVGSNTLTFDANGNLTKDDAGQQYVYDAWNRLVAVKNSGGTTIATYNYDGLHRRIVENIGTANDLYYSDQWQVLEERLGGVSTATIQYVWSPVYVDALVLRDRSTQNNGTLDERLWVQQDANWNVTALINGSGAVVERYVYDPYGKPTFLNASWGTLSGSAYASIYLFQGGRYSTTSGLYYLRLRDLSPALGRWLQTDPLGFNGDGQNLYRFALNSPTGHTDPSGALPILIAVVAIVVIVVLLSPDTANAPTIYDTAHGTPDETIWTSIDVVLAYYGIVGLVDEVAAYILSLRPAGTSAELAAAAQRARVVVGAGRGPAYGTRLHSEFERQIMAIRRGDLTTEVSYLNGRVVPRGTPGSVRLHVVEGPVAQPRAVYDLKSGGAKLTPQRINEIQQHVPGGRNVPVNEVR